MQKVPEEIYRRINNDIYDQEGDKWWHSDFSLNLIKALFNPFRVGYLRKIIERLNIKSAGTSALEVGCGGGILCEEIAGIGFNTTGVDPSVQSLKAATEHSLKNGLKITYLRGAGEDLPFSDNTFDFVFCCDVLEHVRDLPGVIFEISRVLKPEGIFIFDTINRTFMSKLVVIKVLQEWKLWAMVPSHLHEWEMFIKPAELNSLLLKNHLSTKEHVGIKPDISVFRIIQYLKRRASGGMTYEEFGKKFRLIEGGNTNIMYMGYAIKDH